MAISSSSPKVNVAMRDDEYEELRKLAEKNERSMAAEARLAIRDHLVSARVLAGGVK